MGSVLTLMHAYQLRSRAAAYADAEKPPPQGTLCFSWGGDVLVVGIIANYAAVAADTFSSELGILAKSQPRLITSWTLRRVPRGTNGGVTGLGLAAGLLGSMVVVTAAMLFLPSCSPETAAAVGGGTPWLMGQRRIFMGFLVLWGALGSVVDSFLGGLLQRSVRDVGSGKIVAGEGGERVLVSAAAGGSTRRGKGAATAQPSKGSAASGRRGEGGAADGDSARNKQRRRSVGKERPSRVVECGWDVLDNNDVNFLMASMMSVGAMAVASWYWGVAFESAVRA